MRTLRTKKNHAMHAPLVRCGWVVESPCKAFVAQSVHHKELNTAHASDALVALMSYWSQIDAMKTSIWHEFGAGSEACAVLDSPWYKERGLKALRGPHKSPVTNVHMGCGMGSFLCTTQKLKKRYHKLRPGGPISYQPNFKVLTRPPCKTSKFWQATPLLRG